MVQLKPIVPVPPMRRDMDLIANRLPSTRDLAGRSIALAFDDGAGLVMELGEAALRWEAREPSGRVQAGEDAWDAVEIRPGIFFLDFAASDGRCAFSNVIDFNAGRALTVWNEVTGEGDSADLYEMLRPGRIVGMAGSYVPVAETRDLLGKRLYCEYSPEAALEHIYVNSKTIIWQWLLSPEALKYEVGIEAVTMWKIAEELYLISTRDQPPMELTLLIDLQQMRNVGRLFGYSPYGVLDRRVGATVTFLGKFDYPAGYLPG
ncbi:MAG: MoaF N-terminal domain-containing protein [Candidatus Andeanibacterium colombiense]|uniref:MoaF N-terminal domain-containing protein n=1 Tax=Candidatus Andeanibacterium colombiense TaxID=3121345 RepID=A0AAJ5X574_9SPHN|nr:MAG: MoaF N-terminal domain-containing protein [Sphingomonadaceae bacterium]